MIRNFITCLILFALILQIPSEAQNAEVPHLSIKKATKEIIIDGIGNEIDWQLAEKSSSFYQYFPSDTSYSTTKTEVWLTYDDNYIYVLAKCYRLERGRYLTTSLRRDFRGTGNDSFSVLLDTFLDNTNAVTFGINPFGVMREAQISNGGAGRGSFDLSWDNKWQGKTNITDEYWVAEMAIPFKTLRFEEGSSKWNINFYRLDSKYNERSSWAPIPRNFQIFSLAFMGELNWDQPLKKPGTNITLIPYLAGAVSKNHEDIEPEEVTSGIGGDVKISISPSLNLDLTINPDFSQVEVDRQRTNLSRFEISFPERRQFFQENSDLFANYGSERIRPFFTRRIGIAKDTADQNIQIPIRYGMRLSGKLNRNWRVGLLNMQTAREFGAELTGIETIEGSYKLPSQNYTVAVFQRKIFSRSNIGAFFVNRQAANYNKSDTTLSTTKYNRVFGIDYNLASANNKWNGKIFYHHSISPDSANDDFAHGAKLEYNSRRFSVQWDHQIVTDSYNAEVGFVPRKGFKRIRPEFTYRFYPSSGIFNSHGPEFNTNIIWTSEDGRTDQEDELSYFFRMQNQSFLKISAKREYTYLFDDFDPTRGDNLELAAGTDYTYYNFNFFYRGNPRNDFYFNLRGNAGEYFNGNRYNIGGDLNYRAMPWGLFTLNFNYNRINLPKPYSKADIFLVGPRIDLTFTKSLFLTTLVQYNSLIDNVNLNTRFQWRFKPVSDIFLVYTDNYQTGTFDVKNRAIVLKVTYWLNL